MSIIKLVAVQEEHFYRVILPNGNSPYVCYTRFTEKLPKAEALLNSLSFLMSRVIYHERNSQFKRENSGLFAELTQLIIITINREGLSSI